jgi:hypothetical protein
VNAFFLEFPEENGNFEQSKTFFLSTYFRLVDSGEVDKDVITDIVDMRKNRAARNILTACYLLSTGTSTQA